MMVNYILLLVAAPVLWLLSRHDPAVRGENKLADLARRMSLWMVTAILIGFYLWIEPSGGAAALALAVILLALGFLWFGCLSALLFPASQAAPKPARKGDADTMDQSVRNLNMVANLIKEGKTEQALKLCAIYQEFGTANVPQTKSQSPGIVTFREGPTSASLEKAQLLREQGKIDGARTILNSLLAQDPTNIEAVFLLMRLYVEDLDRIDKAMGVLRSFRPQLQALPEHIESARRLFQESIEEDTMTEAAPPPPKTTNELLAQGYFGTAVEILERRAVKDPENFDLLMQLAEAHGVHCHNLIRAEKIVLKIEASSVFTRDQVLFAEAKLKEWQKRDKRW